MTNLNILKYIDNLMCYGHLFCVEYKCLIYTLKIYIFWIKSIKLWWKKQVNSGDYVIIIRHTKKIFSDESTF